MKNKKTHYTVSMKFIRKFLWLIFLFFLACILIGAGYYIAVTKDAQLDPQKLVLHEKSIEVYDAQNQSVENTANFFQKQTVKSNSIPLITKQAFVAIEDKRFFSHDGFDFKRIVKAALNNAKARSYKEGASTISQQLIKNTHLSQEKTLKRKLREWKLTRALESRYTKEEILEKYLNSIYFGHSCFGLRAAADFYFNKSPKHLTLSESAILAGLVKSPNHYSPFSDPEKCKKRKECVLACMVKNKYITPTQKEQAMQEPLPLARDDKNANKGYLYFVFDELSTLSEQYRFPIGGNVKIYTYLDKSLQTSAETLAKQYADSDASFMVLDTKSGGFKTCVSSACNLQRLPGSVIKPLLIYAPAIEEDLLSPATPILDEPIRYGDYAPENYNGKYYGYVSARECLAKSLNIPAVKILSSLGVKKGVSYLQKQGLSVEKNDESLALALGGMSHGFTLKELMQAYNVFPNEGVFRTCGFIKKIQINGATVYQKKDNTTRVFSKEAAYLTTDMLRTASKTGTAKKLRSLPFDVAAKTGTVGAKQGNTDAYTISYTAKDCIGVWLGNRDNTPITQTGGGKPCDFSFALHNALCDRYKEHGVSIPAFQRPTNVVKATLDKISYYDTHTILLADDASPMEYTMEEVFKKSALPNRKSTRFSTPSIPAPSLEFEGNSIRIMFDVNTPKFYQYKIERYDYATHNTLYFGDFQDTFIDDTVAREKRYVYSITPYFKGIQGKKITLPEIVIPAQTIPKEWWKE